MSEFNTNSEEASIFKTIFEDSLEGILIVDEITMKFYMGNKMICEMLGYSKTELMNLGIMDIHPKDAIEYVVDVFKKLLTREMTVAKQIPVQRKDGSVFYADISSIPITIENRKYLIGYFQDVTERKKAYDALKESEEKYRILVDTSPTAIVMGDPQGNIILINDYLAKMHEFKDSEDFYRNVSNISEIVAPESIELLSRELQEVLDSGYSKLNEYKLLKKDGTIFFASVTASLIRDERGKPISFIAVAIDITEQKKAEHQLAETEALLSAVIEQSPVPIIVATPDGTVPIFNQALVDFLGVDNNPEIVPGLNLFTFNKPYKDLDENGNEIPLEKLPLALALQGIKTKQKEMSVIRKDGEQRWEIVEGVPILDKQGNVIAGCIIFQDITDRKMAEQQIQKDLLEKEIMLKEIHHRVKNNLNVTISLLKLQAARIETKEQAISAFQESINSIYAMALVHENLYRTDNFMQVDMKSYIQTLSRSLLNFYSNTIAVDIKIDIQDVFLDINNAIPCGLIINELITNALKHAFPGKKRGLITIELRQMKNDFLEFIIADNGIGLSADFNIDNVESLGLRLVKLLSSQIDGILEITRNDGTRFCLRFPKVYYS